MTDNRMRPVSPGLPDRVEKRTASTPHLAQVWRPSPYDDADHRAFQALRDGTASAEQQQRALGWLIFASGCKIPPYVPGDGGDRDTAFGLGKQLVGWQVMWFLEHPVSGAANDEQGVR